MCSANTGTQTTADGFSSTRSSTRRGTPSLRSTTTHSTCRATGSCRSGKGDPNLFGIFQGNRRGLWFIAAELIRDVAALNKMEVLVWDVWGAMPKSDTRFDAALLKYFDQLAALTHDPDASFDDLMTLYRYDHGVQVPPVVFNVITNHPETI
jgi:hypothetical protein